MTPAESEDLEYPSLMQSAEQASEEQQAYFYGAVGLQLALLVSAAFAALIPKDDVGEAGPTATLILLLLAIGVQVSGIATRAEQRWYDARAAAESIKSASWQYAVGGESFRITDEDAANRFTEMLRDVLRGLPSLNIGTASSLNASVTPSMKRVRDTDRLPRQTAYKLGRVQDQVNWYSEKAAKNKIRSRQFAIAIVAVEVGAVVLGILRVKGSVDLDLLSAFAAGAAGLVGWTQAKKYASLAEAYAVTSHETSLVAASLDSVDTEDEWAQSVHDAEAAFSREHTMWRARRQGPKLP